MDGNNIGPAKIPVFGSRTSPVVTIVPAKWFFFRDIVTFLRADAYRTILRVVEKSDSSIVHRPGTHHTHQRDKVVNIMTHPGWRARDTKGTNSPARGWSQDCSSAGRPRNRKTKMARLTHLPFPFKYRQLADRRRLPCVEHGNPVEGKAKKSSPRRANVGIKLVRWQSL